MVEKEGKKMTRKLYVESLEMIKELYLPDTPLMLEELAKENGYYFTQDDMANCYFSYNGECEDFYEVPDFEF